MQKLLSSPGLDPGCHSTSYYSLNHGLAELTWNRDALPSSAHHLFPSLLVPNWSSCPSLHTHTPVMAWGKDSSRDRFQTRSLLSKKSGKSENLEPLPLSLLESPKRISGIGIDLRNLHRAPHRTNRPVPNELQCQPRLGYVNLSFLKHLPFPTGPSKKPKSLPLWDHSVIPVLRVAMSHPFPAGPAYTHRPVLSWGS